MLLLPSHVQCTRLLPRLVMSSSCNPVDCSLQAHVCGILQATILEWVAIFFFRGFSQSRDWTHIPGRFFTTESPGKRCQDSRVDFTISGWSQSTDSLPRRSQLSHLPKKGQELEAFRSSPLINPEHSMSPQRISFWLVATRDKNHPIF